MMESAMMIGSEPARSMPFLISFLVGYQSSLNYSRIFNYRRLQALGILHVDCLDIAVKLLLSALLVVALSGYPDTQSVWNSFDASLPHLLVELRVQANVGSTLG
jgi:hypothetical protein